MSGTTLSVFVLVLACFAIGYADEPKSDQFVSLFEAEAQSLARTKAHLQQEIARNLARQSALQKESAVRSASDLAAMKLELQHKRLSARKQHLLNEMKLSAKALHALGNEDLDIENKYRSHANQHHSRVVTHRAQAPSLVEVANTPHVDQSHPRKLSFRTPAGTMQCDCRLDSFSKAGATHPTEPEELSLSDETPKAEPVQQPIKGAADTSAPWIHAPEDGSVPPVYGLKCFESCQEYKCRKDFPTYGFDQFHDCVISCVERCYRGDNNAIRLAEVAFHRQEVANKKVERELEAGSIDGLL